MRINLNTRSTSMPVRKKEEIQSVLTARLNDYTKKLSIEILEDNASARGQTIRVNYWNDDFGYFSVYKVDDLNAKPIAYADSVKRDGAMATLAGIEIAILFYLLGRIGFAVIVRYQDWQQKRQPTH